VAVVGAGPAGIVTALELERRGFSVCLLESGFPRHSRFAQKLGDSDEFDPQRHAPMNVCTRRQLGGAPVIWGGRCVPYDPVDFDKRPYIPHSDWPIKYQDLVSYFDKASEYCFTGPAKFSTHDLEEIRQKSIVPGLEDDEILTTTLERWSLPTNFGKEYRERLRCSSLIQVYFGITVTEVVCNNEGDHIDHLVAKTEGRAPFIVRCRYLVLACGGLDTTRLLLASRRHHSEGIGNRSGLLGRFYMGHISGKIAQVHFTGNPRQTVFGYHRDRLGVYVRPRFSFSRQFLHSNRLTNVVAWLANPAIGDPTHGNGVLSFAYLALASPFGRYLAAEAIRQAAIANRGPKSIARHLRNIACDPLRTMHFAVTFGYQRYLAWRRIPGFFQYAASNTYDIHYHGEQVPNHQSRVWLSSKVDELDMPRLNIELRYSQQDIDSVIRAHRYIDSYLQRHDAGYLTFTSSNLEEAVWAQAADGYHQIGTTRMSAEANDGVVDPDCCVHGIDNLYVASSSVFVTSGQANSTFMILVFALRLAEHLGAQLERRRTAAVDSTSLVV
jgi:hypothetical protein